MNLEYTILIISIFAFSYVVAFYLITALQWYSYKIERILFHFSKPLWHVYFILLPTLIFIYSYKLFLLLFIPYLFCLFFWHKKLDKKLVFTKKVKIFFVFTSISVILFSLNLNHMDYRICALAVLFAIIMLKIYSLFEARYFYNKAKNKIKNMNNLKIILITASYGKTSIKNFLFELLNDNFKVYKTPRSVNTLVGIIQDINKNLNDDNEFYIAEAGARKEGDILEITNFLEPQFCIVGEIGNSHLEYFKTIENIRKTKLEALSSKRLIKAFLHSSTEEKENDKQAIYDTRIKEIKANLENISFKMIIDETYHEFKANLLGEFNAYNLGACILCANYLGLNIDEIQTKLKNIKQVEHRLQIISKEPKFIIDDGFNGNFNGMSKSYELCKNYNGRRVLVSPGIMEVNDEENIKLAKIINECFDLAIITSHKNAKLFNKELKIEKIILKDKNELIDTLAKTTKNKDLILFSNDAPNFM